MKNNQTLLSRRKLIKTLGTVAATSPLIALTACGSNGSSSSTSTTASSDNTGGIISSNTNTNTNVSGSSDWLSGGTNAMEADFPPANDPFDSGLGNLCTLTDNFTVGPCYFDYDNDRDDISEGQPGVPMTLAMKLVDDNCQPIEGAVIEVWWCDAQGIYSGNNAGSTGSVSEFNAGFCTGNDAEALNSRWFRGTKTTDSVGNVYFKACFPGWYPSRTTHIHFRIVVNGNQQLISQFGFDDSLSNDIYLNHSDYTGREKDTSNNSDTVFPADGYEAYLFEVERQWDNSMLVYKAVQIKV